jgi:acyl-CoA thioester hydrolase
MSELKRALSHRIEIPVRFNEADPLGVVWHGHYLRYFEDGREAFGKAFGIAYLDFYRQGLAVPIVSAHCDYKKPLRYGDSMVVETIYEPTAAAKLIFRYNILSVQQNEVIATGTTTQVFVDVKTFDLHLTMPPFFEAWRKQQGA